jgi:hypothetical protein
MIQSFDGGILAEWLAKINTADAVFMSAWGLFHRH